MAEIKKKIIFKLFSFIFIVSSTLFLFQTETLYASESDQSAFIKKVSRSYTKKYCNAIGFGLSKESAMNFSIEENKQVFKKKKEFNSINQDILAEEIAISVVEKCGYPINLSGEKGIQIFKSFYLSKASETSKKD
ncbi:hypothetical protein [Prochlorococcus marinus]|uniref:hypothetical protein n=1 Tax=Prochlorococcus marinus TaxID=1219 RepID=UPI0022B50EDB|nr:hypothetical protein [Prochlorococcus marinus]